MKLFSRNLFSYRNYIYFCNAENGRLWQVHETGFAIKMETGHAPSLQGKCDDIFFYCKSQKNIVILLV